MKIYLSGPMSGLPDLNFPAFHAEAARLRALGHTVMNPAEINTNKSLSWEQCLRADIRALCECDTLAYLPNWEASSGVHLEMSIAHRLKIEIVASSTFDTVSIVEAQYRVTHAQWRHPVVVDDGEMLDWLNREGSILFPPQMVWELKAGESIVRGHESITRIK